MKSFRICIFQVEIRGDLVIPSVALSDEGTYSCRGTNEVGSRQMDVKLKVRQPPRFQRTPKNQTIRVGQEAIFDCEMLGNVAKFLLIIKIYQYKIPMKYLFKIF